MLASEAARRDSLTRFVFHVHSHWHHDSCVQPSRKRDKEFIKHKHSGYVLLSGGRFPPLHRAPYDRGHFRGRAGSQSTAAMLGLACLTPHFHTTVTPCCGFRVARLKTHSLVVILSCGKHILIAGSPREAGSCEFSPFQVCTRLLICLVWVLWVITAGRVKSFFNV